MRGLKCSECKRSIGSGIGFVYEHYHTLYGPENKILDVYCLKCWREKVMPLIPEDAKDLDRLLEELEKRKRAFALKAMSERMRAEENMPRFEP